MMLRRGGGTRGAHIQGGRACTPPGSAGLAAAQRSAPSRLHCTALLTPTRFMSSEVSASDQILRSARGRFRGSTTAGSSSQQSAVSSQQQHRRNTGAAQQRRSLSDRAAAPPPLPLGHTQPNPAGANKYAASASYYYYCYSLTSSPRSSSSSSPSPMPPSSCRLVRAQYFLRIAVWLQVVAQRGGWAGSKGATGWMGGRAGVGAGAGAGGPPPRPPTEGGSVLTVHLPAHPLTTHPTPATLPLPHCSAVQPPASSSLITHHYYQHCCSHHYCSRAPPKVKLHLGPVELRGVQALQAELGVLHQAHQLLRWQVVAGGAAGRGDRGSSRGPGHRG